MLLSTIIETMLRASGRAPGKSISRILSRRMTTTSQKLIHVEKSVEAALANGEPVVALEVRQAC
jgi:hypothetical protein